MYRPNLQITPDTIYISICVCVYQIIKAFSCHQSKGRRLLLTAWRREEQNEALKEGMIHYKYGTMETLDRQHSSNTVTLQPDVIHIFHLPVSLS